MAGIESPLPPFYAPPKFNLENIKNGEIFSWAFWNTLYVIVTPVKATLYLGSLAWNKLSGKPIASRNVKPEGVDCKINQNHVPANSSIGKSSLSEIRNSSSVRPGEKVRAVSEDADQQRKQVASPPQVSNHSQLRYTRQRDVLHEEQSDLAQQLRMKEINERNYKRAEQKSLKHGERETLKEVLRTSCEKYLADQDRIRTEQVMLKQVRDLSRREERRTQQRLQKELKQADLDYQFAQLEAADLRQADHQPPTVHGIQQQGISAPDFQQAIWESLTKQRSSSIQVNTPKPRPELPPMTISEHVAEEAKRGHVIYFQDQHVIAWLLDKKDALMRNNSLKEGLEKCSCDLTKVSEAEWSQVLSGWKITKNDFHTIYGLANDMPLRIKLVEKLITHKVNVEQVHQAQLQRIIPSLKNEPAEQPRQAQTRQTNPGQEKKPATQTRQAQLQRVNLDQKKEPSEPLRQAQPQRTNPGQEKKPAVQIRQAQLQQVNSDQKKEPAEQPSQTQPRRTNADQEKKSAAQIRQAQLQQVKTDQKKEPAEQSRQAQPQQINPGEEKKPITQALQPKLQQVKFAQENEQRALGEQVRITQKVAQVEIGTAEASKLKSEPPDNEHDVFSIHFQTGNGMIIRRFWPDDPVQSLLDFLDTKGYPSTDFKLVTDYPRRELDSVSLTMRELELELGNKFAVRVVKK